MNTCAHGWGVQPCGRCEEDALRVKRLLAPASGELIVEQVAMFLERRGPHVIPPHEDDDKPWDYSENPLVLVVDPVNGSLTAVRWKDAQSAIRKGQCT